MSSFNRTIFLFFALNKDDFFPMLRKIGWKMLLCADDSSKGEKIPSKKGLLSDAR